MNATFQTHAFLRNRLFHIISISLFLISISYAGTITGGLARYPDLYGDQIVFTSSGDLYLGSVKGGTATRLTAHEGQERFAFFSPDGKWIAFSGHYYGNEDVFLIPANGGEPRQLTYHPSQDDLVGWDNDNRVVFRSRREAPRHAWELYTVDMDGGFPVKMPFERGGFITFEPNGKRVALTNTFLAFHTWKRYQGGYAEKIWVGDPAKPSFKICSSYDGNESFPMWANDGRIYFVSDSLGDGNIWSMKPDGSDAKSMTSLTEFDVRFPNLANDNRIIFQHGSDLKIYNVQTGTITAPDIYIPTDRYVAMTKFVDPSEYVTHWSVSNDGKRLVVTARGEIFTLPVKQGGLIRQWTFSSGSREKYGVFFPESVFGIAAISDETGENSLVRIVNPGETPLSVEKASPAGWKYRPAISPDGKWIVYGDLEQELRLVNVESGKGKVIATGEWEFNDYVWSPDSRYLAYASTLQSGIISLWIYDVEKGKNHKISDDRFSTANPAWDPNGKYLYCTTDRNFNGYQDYNRGLFLFDHESTLALYRLTEDTPSPFLAYGDAPDAGAVPQASWLEQSDKEEKKEKDEKDEDEKSVQPILIDFKGLGDRMVPLPEKPGNYYGLGAVENKLYFLAWEISGIRSGHDRKDYSGPYLRMFDLAKRESSDIASKVGGYEISADNSTLIVHSGGSWYYGDAGANSFAMDGDHTVSTSGWKLEVTPSEEWHQIVKEAWRHQRDFFYSENMHGQDWKMVLERYGSMIDLATTRDDVRDIISLIFRELRAGHAYIGPGDEPDPESAPIGFLGVRMYPDVKSGYYIIDEVLAPEPGTENASSPLYHSDPNTGRGTYILAIDGRPVRANENIYRLLQDKAGKEVALLLNESPKKEGAREVFIKTIRNENYMRYLQWVKENREYVASKSDGKIGYIQLPDMGGEGLSQWGRDYYGQRNKKALIIDDRFNGGGNVSEYMLKELKAEVWAIQGSRRGVLETKPHGGYYGHIAVLCNGETMSDGESFAEATKRLELGKLIGEQTWGGWLWIRMDKPLVDNAYISEPEFGGWGIDGEWMIEGRGVLPEMEVVNDPASEIKGEDPQLDAAIEHLLQEIKNNPKELPGRPEGVEKH